MRSLFLIRLIALIAFAIFGGPTPVVAAGGQAMLCAFTGGHQVVAYDFENGKPITAAEALPKCDDCLGGGAFLPPGETASPTATAPSAMRPAAARITAPNRPIAAPSARAPPV